NVKMENKLQELTDKIYQEGITRGKQEAENIISAAEEEADKIIKSAEARAEEIISNAKKESEELKKNTLSELRISFRNAMNGLRQDIENMITVKVVDEPVKDALSDTSFISRLIEDATSKLFTESNNSGADVNVPEEMKEKIEQYLREKTNKSLSSGLVLIPDRTMEKGFEIIPHGKDYKVRVTEDDLKIYMRDFLRSRLADLLFEEDK
ncbi:MAG TPA: hypothetical protein PLR52_09880, partial [Bacteroidales bacterium]|nr:hypothetical protein [Bacteroidales bacterium]